MINKVTLEGRVKDLNALLHDMATQPLPGAVAAAAMAAAMGAALVAKATQVTLRHRVTDVSDRTLLETVHDLAQVQRIDLARLAGADERAYRAVLGTRTLAAEDLARRQAQKMATVIPLCIAEACQLLLSNLHRLAEICWPAVRSEIQTGGWLLEVGMRAGLLAAESNLCAWGDDAEAKPFQARMNALQDHWGNEQMNKARTSQTHPHAGRCCW